MQWQSHTTPAPNWSISAACAADPGLHPARPPRRWRWSARRPCWSRRRSARHQRPRDAVHGLLRRSRRATIVDSMGEGDHDDRTRLRYVVDVVARRTASFGTAMSARLRPVRGHRQRDGGAGRHGRRHQGRRHARRPPRRPAPCPWSRRTASASVLHEACGITWSDAVGKGASIYAGKLGTRIAAPIVDAYDDAACPTAGARRPLTAEVYPDPAHPGHQEQASLIGYLCRPAARAPRRVRPDRRRPPAVVPPHPHPRMTTTYIASSSTRDQVHQGDRLQLLHGQPGPRCRSSRPAAPSCSASPRLPDRRRPYHRARCARATLIGGGIDMLLRIDMITDNRRQVRRLWQGRQGCRGRRIATLRISKMTKDPTA